MKIKNKLVFGAIIILIVMGMITGCATNSDKDKKSSYIDVLEAYFDALSDENSKEIVECSFSKSLLKCLDVDREDVIAMYDEYYKDYHELQDTQDGRWYKEYGNVDIVAKTKYTDDDIQSVMEDVEYYTGVEIDIDFDNMYELQIKIDERTSSNPEWFVRELTIIVYEINDEWYVFNTAAINQLFQS